MTENNHSAASDRVQETLPDEELIAQIGQASSLEMAGQIEEAKAIYQEVVAADPDGNLGASARRALEAIEVVSADPLAVTREDTDLNWHSHGASALQWSDQSVSPSALPAVREDSDTSEQLIAMMARASTLEQVGDLQQAREIYEEVAAADRDGSVGASARKALLSLESASRTPSSAGEKPESRETPALGWFARLPIAWKQFSALLAAGVVPAIALIGVGTWSIASSGRSQLADRSAAELRRVDREYHLKIDQMGWVFRARSDNLATIEAATLATNGSELPADLQAELEQMLQEEMQAQTIEYATLVDRSSRIVANANGDRTGEVFDPQGLVSRFWDNPQPMQTSAIVSWEELQAEAPPLPEGLSELGALIRYTVTPVTGSDGEVVGALVSGDLVNGKLPIVEETVKAFETEGFGGGYAAVYMVHPETGLSLATGVADLTPSQRDDDAIPGQELSDESVLQAAIANPEETARGWVEIGGQTYAVAARAISDLENNPVAVIVRGTPKTQLNALLFTSLRAWGVALGVVLLMNLGLAYGVTSAIANPIKNLQRVAGRYVRGDRRARVAITSGDEIGQLGQTFNELADNIELSEAALVQETELRQQEVDYQREEKERLQQSVVKLLLDIEGAKQGDLTVRAAVDESEMGSVADAFNTSIRSLQELVTQMQSAAVAVQTAATKSEDSVRALSQEATTQEGEISTALTSVEEMSQSIQSVANSATEAAAIARQAREMAREGQQAMDRTVGSIDNIRASAADTAKKVKRLAESSQEISKIVNIISGISEKTNLLAFNASIEAARAGENGQGFRIVADEVRRLAERVTAATQEIEQLVNTIQSETAGVLQTMEASTEHVVAGTQLVGGTKQSLEQVARISQKIDEVLQAISSSTITQAQASEMVTHTMQQVAQIARESATESQTVARSLQELVRVAEQLQGSVSRFRVE